VSAVSEATRTVRTAGGKASLNVPLLARCYRRWSIGNPNVAGVLHLHEQLRYPQNIPLLPYAPPGTWRDTNREIDVHPKAINIEGHGFVAAIGKDGYILA